MKSVNSNIEPINSEEIQIPPKRALILIILLSSGLDFFLTSFSYLSWITTLGGSIIIEELIEYIISRIINRYSFDLKVKPVDKILGFLPIPGVTSISIRCLKILRKHYF